MVSLDQVILLEQKVESAVAKIQQLQAENDALRNKCLELTNALSSKSEQLTSFESDQNQIESGIKKALDRLNFIENSLLKSVGQVASTSSTTIDSSLNSNTNLDNQVSNTNKSNQGISGISNTLDNNTNPVKQSKPDLQPSTNDIQTSTNIKASGLNIPSFYNMEPAVNNQDNKSVSVAEQELEETIHDYSIGNSLDNSEDSENEELSDISIPLSSTDSLNEEKSPIPDSDSFEIFDESDNSDELGFDIF